MSVTDGIGQTPCSFEHYLVVIISWVLWTSNITSCATLVLFVLRGIFITGTK